MKNNNYLFPFFFVRDTVSPEVLREDMRRLSENGIKGVCIEPSGNKHFAEDPWWAQMDAIIESAEKYGMRIWLQDEPQFPTGNANRKAAQRPDLHKVHLEEMHFDVYGPQKEQTFLLKEYFLPDGMLYWLKHMPGGDAPARRKDPKTVTYENDPQLLAIVARKMAGKGRKLTEEMIDLTHLLREDGRLIWDVPEGQWRIFVLLRRRAQTGRQNYLNLIDRDSVAFLIEKLYEPHFKRYGDKFGGVFAGFFTDEPEMGNVSGYNLDDSIGRKMMPLPWSRETEEILRADWGEKMTGLLPDLWYDDGKCSPEVREHYMDVITQLYRKNFCGQIGDWCRAHGCEYIGHVLEDQGLHAKLGAGAGHYFRAMEGQDFAGVDLVEQQIRYGLDKPDMNWFTCEESGEFFHYGLAKMGSSAAHIQPNKKGRLICELFNAYGYSLGYREMKWLYDHMLVRGVNYYVPTYHAPPTEKGSRYDLDPQFRHNALLSGYVNRVCNLLTDGDHIAPVAVLYHAESEWSGDYMPFETPGGVLMRSQIDYDVVPQDAFTERDKYKTVISPRGLTINTENYQALVIPYSQYLTPGMAKAVRELTENNVPVYFVDGKPEKVLGEEKPYQDDAQVAALEELPGVLDGIRDIRPDRQCDGLRYFHYHHQDDEDWYFMNNEDINHAVETEIAFADARCVSLYDALNERWLPVKARQDAGKTFVSLYLEPFQSVFVVFGRDEQAEKLPEYKAEIPVEGPWQVSFAEEYPQFGPKEEMQALHNTARDDSHSTFSGTIRYEKEVELKNAPMQAQIDLGEVFDVAEVFVNGISAGVRICPPYRFDISGLLKEGKNEIKAEVINTLIWRHDTDLMSAFAAVNPSGLLGPVKIRY